MIMDYLTVNDVGRCESVCHTLKNHSKYIWEAFDVRYLMDHPTRQSPSGRNSREKMIRYHVASTLAERVGALGNSITKHAIIPHYDRLEGRVTEARIEDCRGCYFPDLDFAPLNRDTADEYELFLRFSRIDDNELFAEGFALPPHGGLAEDNIQIDLQHMDFSRWEKILEINRLILSETENIDAHYRLLVECMRELAVVIIAVHKVTHKASLAMAQCNFGDDGEPGDNAGVDPGCCWPRGEMCTRSHGHLETEVRDDGYPIWHHIKESHAKLGMCYEIGRWTDPEDSSRILKEECIWTLDCTFRLRRDDSDVSISSDD
jgi:hypothetical protein